MARAKIHLDQFSALPSVCVCCGRSAVGVRRQEFRLDEGLSASVLAASVLLGGMAWTEYTLTLPLPVCAAHRRRGRRSTQTLVRGMALAAGLVAAAYLASLFGAPVSSYLAVVAMFTFIATLVVGMHEVNDGLDVKSLTAGSVTLAGVHRMFAAAVERSGAAECGSPSAPAR